MWILFTTAQDPGEKGFGGRCTTPGDGQAWIWNSVSSPTSEAPLDWEKLRVETVRHQLHAYRRIRPQQTSGNAAPLSLGRFGLPLHGWCAAVDLFLDWKIRHWPELRNAWALCSLNNRLSLGYKMFGLVLEAAFFHSFLFLACSSWPGATHSLVLPGFSKQAVLQFPRRWWSSQIL